MKKRFLILPLGFVLASTVMAQTTTTADRAVIRQGLFLKDKWLDSIQASGEFLQDRTVPTSKAVKNFFYDHLPVTYPMAGDTVTLYSFNTDSTTASNGWVASSGYSATSIESRMTGGLKITSTYNGAYTSTNWNRSKYESSLDDIETVIKFQIKSLDTLPLVGVAYVGATDAFGTNQYDSWNLLTGDLSTSWYNSAYSVKASSGLSFSVGDDVTIIYRRFFHFMYHTIINHTKNKIFTYFINGANVGATSWVTDVYPGFYMQGGSYLLKSFSVIGHGYKPDILITGCSVIQTQSAVTSYDSTATKRFHDLTGLRVVGAAKSANKLQDIYQTLGEVIKMKPKAVIIEAGHNNLLFGEGVSVLGPIYHSIVDSLIASGITPIALKPVPSSWTDLTPLLNFIDSAFGHNPNVRVLDLYTTTKMYNTSFAYNKDVSYYVDAAHLNAAGAREYGYGLARQVKNVFAKKEVEWTVNNTDADYTLPFSVYKVKLKALLTAGRTLTLPPAGSNPFAVLTLANFNSGSFSWSVNQAIRRADGTTFTTLANGKTYTLSVLDGEYFLEREQ